MMRIRPRTPLLRLAAPLLLLAGCSSQIDAIPEPVVRDTFVTPAGIYFGSLSTQSSGDSEPVVALIEEQGDNQQGRALVYSSDGSKLISGRYTTVGSGISIQARQFDLAAPSTPVATISFEGTFKLHDAVLGNYNLRGETVEVVENEEGEEEEVRVPYTDNGEIDLLYQEDLYEKRSATVLLAGTWVNSDAFGTSDVSFSINNDGAITGLSAVTNCNYNGRLDVIDLRFNLYQVTVTEACNAPAGGTGSTPPQGMTGLATLLPPGNAGATPAQLVMAFSSSCSSCGQRGRLFRLSAD